MKIFNLLQNMYKVLENEGLVDDQTRNDYIDVIIETIGYMVSIEC